MPRYYCDYCDTYLTHDSPSVRKQHNAGYKHKANVRSYYQQFEAQQNQSLIDQKIKEHLGQSAYQVSTQSAYQISASYNALRPRFPVLPTPLMPMPGTAQFPMNSPLGPGVRPPIFPRPLPVLEILHAYSTTTKANVRSYYQQFEAQQNQSLIDQKIKEHLGQSAYQVSTQSAYQISASYNALRPRLPVLPTPLMPMPGTAQFPMNSPSGPGVRPPIFPRPLPGYAPAPGMQPMMAPPGAAPMPGQFNSLPRPPTMSGPVAVPGTTTAPPIASGATSMVTPVNSQASSLPTTSGGFDSFNMCALSPEANH